MEINPQAFQKARQTRDPRFDGQFFVAVSTTGIYCRPVCPVKLPKEENVSYFLTAAGATEAGYRPCLRCRPEAAPGTPAWSGTSTTVNRGLRMISEGVLDEIGVEGMSLRLGVTSRHLSRLFSEHLGASPKAVAQIRRLQLAKKLLDETSLTMTDIALSSGYGSVRRFNEHFRKVYQRTPSQIKKKKVLIPASDGLEIELSYRPPFDFDALLDFLKLRATPGVELVEAQTYSRTIVMAGDIGLLSISNRPEKNAIACSICMQSSGQLLRIIEKVKQMFDLTADPEEIKQQLSKDRKLKPLVALHPGQRLPGAWDGFEVALRALVGQQISVVGATRIMGRIVSEYGKEVEIEGRTFYLFPEPKVLAAIEPKTLPMPLGRAMAIRELSRQVTNKELILNGLMDTDDLMEKLLAIKGIGPWTAQYIAMRALNQPDAFLHSDLVIKKVARILYGFESEKELLGHSEKWRPWRAYASMHLWRNAKRLL